MATRKTRHRCAGKSSIIGGNTADDTMTTDVDSASICSQLEEVIRCAICWEPPKQPKILPCQHTFCLRCIQPSYVSGIRERFIPRDRVQCPLCRQGHAMPPGGLASLPTDHRTNVIADIVFRKRSAWGRRLCVVCQTSHKYNDAMYFCLSCGTLLCVTCSGTHKYSRLSKKHLQLDLMKPGTTEINPEMFCGDHVREPIQYHCLDCAKSVCKTCSHTVHDKHNFVEFVPADDGETELVEKVIEYLEARQADITTQREGLVRFKGLTMDDKRELQTQLETVREKMAELQEVEKDLERKVNIHMGIEADLDELDAMLDTNFTAIGDLIDVKLARAFHPIPSREDISISEISLKTLQSDYSKLEEGYRDLLLMRRQYDVIKDNNYMTPDMALSGFPCFYEMTSKVNEGIYAVWHKDISAYDVHFLPNTMDMLYSGLNYEWKMQLMDITGNEKELPDYLVPFKVCDVRLMVNPHTNTICMTHRTKHDKMVLPFSIIHPGVSTVTGHIMTPEDQPLLCGLAVTRHDEMIFTFMENFLPPERTCMLCHYPGGQQHWVKATSRAIKSPHYIAMDHMDRIIVSDHHAHKVTIFNTMGEVILNFPDRDANVDFKRVFNDVKPAGICVDSRSNIYVTFPVLDVVSLFSPQGEFIKHIVRVKGKPRGIALCEDRYLAVCTIDDGMWLFDISGVVPNLAHQSGDESLFPVSDDSDLDEYESAEETNNPAEGILVDIDGPDAESSKVCVEKAEVASEIGEPPDVDDQNIGIDGGSSVEEADNTSTPPPQGDPEPIQADPVPTRVAPAPPQVQPVTPARFSMPANAFENDSAHIIRRNRGVYLVDIDIREDLSDADLRLFYQTEFSPDDELPQAFPEQDYLLTEPDGSMTNSIAATIAIDSIATTSATNSIAATIAMDSIAATSTTDSIATTSTTDSIAATSGQGVDRRNSDVTLIDLSSDDSFTDAMVRQDSEETHL